MASNQEEEVLGKAYDGRLMRRLLTYLRPYKWHVVVAVAAIILKSGLDVLGPFLTMIAIDKYLAKSPDSHSSSHSWIGDRLSSTPLTGIAQIGGLYVGILGLTFALEFVQTYLMQWTGQKVMFDLRKQIFRHLQHMHVAFFDKNPVGRLVTRVTTDVDALNEMFTAGVVSIFEDVFVLAGIIGIMMHTNWKLALITFAALPIIVYATRVFRDKVRDSYRRIRTAIARINSYLQEAVSGMLVLQLFNREKRALNKFSDINASHMEAYKDAILAYAVYYPVVEILSSIAIASIVWFGGRDVIRGVTTIGVLVAFMQYAQRFFRPIQDLSEKYNILQSAMAAGERVFKLLDTKIEITSPASAKKPQGPGRIEFDHVWFAYGNKSAAEKAADSSSRPGQAGAPVPTQTPGQVGAPVPTRANEPDWVLRDVSFAIEPGETIAVVGHTGAGKTTLISLLMRFYDVQRGAVRIDGLDIKEMNLDDLRGRFGVVLQDPFLFSGTVEGNIRLGTTRIQDADVEQAAEDVNLADFIRSWPGGFKEEVRERGSTLSTGQKQLISFARALAHNPKILILDEAT
ncbi:MAG: ABC transporter ATP-binding protein, partial [Terriglobales bacterium]